MTTTITSQRLDDAALQSLKERVRGAVIQPGNPDYAAACTVYNVMIDRHPALIVRCVDVADVISAVNFARDQNMLTAIRGGGHNVAGLSTVDGGLVIDLGQMRGIHVDPTTRTARVEAGCT